MTNRRIFCLVSSSFTELKKNSLQCGTDALLLLLAGERMQEAPTKNKSRKRERNEKEEAESKEDFSARAASLTKKHLGGTYSIRASRDLHEEEELDGKDK